MKLGIEELSIIVEGLRLRVKQLSSSVTEINQSIENLETEDGSKAPAIMQTTSPAAIASFSDGSEDMPIKSLKCTIVAVQAGTGDPAPDNIRPITGWNGVTVVRKGKNLLNTTVETYTKNGVTLTRNSDGTYHVYGTPTGTADFNLASSIDLVIGASYILSGCPEGGASNKYKLDLYMIVGSPTDYGSGASFTSSAASALPRIVIYETAGAVDLTFAPMLRIASMSDATFEPYTGDSQSITFPQTVYGGWVDVIKGELHLTNAYVNLNGSESWEYYSVTQGNLFRTTRQDKYSVVSATNTLCSTYKPTNVRADNTLTGSGRYLDIVDNRYSTIEEFKAALTANNVQVVYTLAEEQIIPIDPVTITTLLGSNNIYCNTGTVEVEYAADTKMYIDNAVAAVIPEPEPTPEPEQDEVPPEEEEEAEPAPEEEIAEPELEEVEEAAEVEEIEPVVKKSTRKK